MIFNILLFVWGWFFSTLEYISSNPISFQTLFHQGYNFGSAQEGWATESGLMLNLARATESQHEGMGKSYS